MEHPVRVAFCPILFGKNGGRFTEKGLPIFQDGIRGSCDRAFDCGHCPYLAEWIQHYIDDGWAVGWECDQCLRDTKSIPRTLPGFYQAGRPEKPPEDAEHDADQPGLEGCTRCGWATSFLQLVLREE